MPNDRPMRLTADLVALCHRDVPDPGPDARYEMFTAEQYEAAARELLAQIPECGFWLFAYGSLIWKPEFATETSCRAVAHGWHRAFSLKINRYRGSDEQHGYMMCLDPGGSCEGVALKLSDSDLYSQVLTLLKREIGNEDTMEAARWIDLETENGPIKALTFYAHPHFLDIYLADRPLSEIAHALPRACGHWGSGAEYLFNTVLHLESMGIHDPELWILQEMVADEIASMMQAPVAG